VDWLMIDRLTSGRGSPAPVTALQQPVTHTQVDAHVRSGF